MTDRAVSALATAWRTTKTLRGQTVTYHSRSDSVQLVCVLSRPQSQQADGEEEITFESRSWNALIDPTWPADAPDAFTRHEPSLGDRIVTADGTTYLVQPSEAGDTAWRWSDGHKTFRRINVEQLNPAIGIYFRPGTQQVYLRPGGYSLYFRPANAA